MFQLFTKKFKCTLGDKLDISEIIDFFTSEDIENVWILQVVYFPVKHLCLYNILFCGIIVSDPQCIIW